MESRLENQVAENPVTCLSHQRAMNDYLYTFGTCTTGREAEPNDHKWDKWLSEESYYKMKLHLQVVLNHSSNCVKLNAFNSIYIRCLTLLEIVTFNFIHANFYLFRELQLKWHVFLMNVVVNKFRNEYDILLPYKSNFKKE